MCSAYYEGWHAPKLYAKALNYYGLAVEQGHDLAMIALGEIYLEGNGVIKSRTRVAAWIKKAVHYAETDEPLWLYDPEKSGFIKANEFFK